MPKLGCIIFFGGGTFAMEEGRDVFEVEGYTIRV